MPLADRFQRPVTIISPRQRRITTRTIHDCVRGLRATAVCRELKRVCLGIEFSVRLLRPRRSRQDSRGENGNGTIRSSRGGTVGDLY